MAAAMNGIALHGGLIPYGGTFLVFTDYCRPAIRLSALMRQRVIYVMTHDSIGLGEDGPTHQPVEHLASLRAIPNLNVFRPADGVETAECWELALTARGHAVDPRADAAGRAERCAPPTTDENLCAKGAYVLAEAEGGARRHAARHRLGGRRRHGGARTLLAKDGIEAAVVSMPCWELFAAPARRLPRGGAGHAPRASPSRPRVGFGWERWLGEQGRLRRHGRLRRLGPGRPAFRALRDHARQGCRHRPRAAKQAEKRVGYRPSRHERVSAPAQGAAHDASG